MTSDTDVLVIGGGVAGAAAALAAAHAGARVTVVRRGPGATALAAGAWDSAPPPAFQDALAAAGLPLEESAGALPHPDGTLVPAPLAAAAQARAALSWDDGLVAERVVICGVAGLPSFRPRALAALWTAAAGLLPRSLEPALLELPGTPRGGWSPVSLAAAVERDPTAFGAAIAHAARERGVARAIVPAVLGLAQHAETLEAVQRAAGLRVGEALGVAPSAPGWRLDRGLLRVLAAANVDVVAGRVSGHEGERAQLRSVTVTGAAAAATIRATTFVLATGKFIGGGITAESAYVESALGCDVAIERFARTITDAGAALVLSDPARQEPQPLLSIGVRTNADALPLRASGDIAWDNVFVAGSVRYGIETSAGLGTAAQDGWNAGCRAARRRAA